MVKLMTISSKQNNFIDSGDFFCVCYNYKSYYLTRFNEIQSNRFIRGPTVDLVDFSYLIVITTIKKDRIYIIYIYYTCRIIVWADCWETVETISIISFLT